MTEPILSSGAKMPHLPGVGYYFSEENSFAFGLMVDMSVFDTELLDRNALFSRFYNRLLNEYDRLAGFAAAARADGTDVYPTDPDEDEPLSISLLSDDVTLFLQIVPAAIEHAAMRKRLPAVLEEFIRLLGDACLSVHG